VKKRSTNCCNSCSRLNRNNPKKKYCIFNDIFAYYFSEYEVSGKYTGVKYLAILAIAVVYLTETTPERNTVFLMIFLLVISVNMKLVESISVLNTVSGDCSNSCSRLNRNNPRKKYCIFYNIFACYFSEYEVSGKCTDAKCLAILADNHSDFNANRPIATAFSFRR
jgi:hypothetical protein